MIDGTLLDATSVDMPQSARNVVRRSMSEADRMVFDGVTLHAITYASANRRIKGYMALPPGGQSSYPAVIFNRGGSTERGALTPEGAVMFACQYAAWGFVCVASNYRGLGGSEGETEEWGAGDVDDAMNLLPLLDGLGYVDPERIGLVGGSRGGMMALMMLARTDRFRAAVTFGAPTMIHACEPTAYIRRTMQKHLPAGSVEHVEAERRSAVLWADRLSKTTPLLVLHGTGDRRVSPDHALQLGLALQHCQHPYKLIMYDNADHVLAGRRNESNADIRAWLTHYVMNRGPLPRVGPHGA
ncbi:MAG: S9 family peptidase [Candidatus Kapabacteria bacterium]|nr:S9 family peptidase [Candidatus Kapabacteria bacterium]